MRKGLWSDPPGLEMRVLRRRLAACAAPHSLIPQVLRLQDAQDRVCGVPVLALDVAARGLLCACALSAGGRLQDNIVKAFIFRWFVSALGRGVCTRHGCGACNSTSPPPAVSRRTGPRGGCRSCLARQSCGRALSTLSRPRATNQLNQGLDWRRCADRRRGRRRVPGRRQMRRGNRIGRTSHATRSTESNIYAGVIAVCGCACAVVLMLGGR